LPVARSPIEQAAEDGLLDFLFFDGPAKRFPGALLAALAVGQIFICLLMLHVLVYGFMSHADATAVYGVRWI
jgi:hypothetical protein